ncbi:retinol dehydrogenase 12-like [Ctenopharyngodon idella]|uniref:retinol dehydrogenase 12-like n=1 Tax=Ctenopharyngodon idella TaxID=7959 RepID=UPI00223208DA|nr:retinol dehydrogenase 12-like [Ctenopharyngodon idella]XP_051772911.1 retinol dehydrogenase 12-like [Ctenopharyngodon idella]
MTWEWSDIHSHPLWMVSTAILAIIVRAQRRVPWNPRACPVELKGKTAIITGANTGIGKFIALDFARRGARVILACRSEARGTAALQEIRDSSGNQNVHLRLLDTSSLESVRKFAARILEEEKELHILVNNAGASGLPSKITADGLEITFATNHIGPFLLTSLLLDLLKKSAPARIVNVSSMNHWKGKVDFSHFRGDNLSNVMDAAYNHTKLHNVIWTNELARRLQGTGVTANSLHPGVVMTDVMRNYNFIIRFLFNLVGFFFFKTPEEGAFSPIYCAISEETEGITGKYFDSDCSLVLAAPPARDPALGVKEYEFCERLTAKP